MNRRSLTSTLVSTVALASLLASTSHASDASANEWVDASVLDVLPPQVREATDSCVSMAEARADEAWACAGGVLNATSASPAGKGASVATDDPGEASPTRPRLGNVDGTTAAPPPAAGLVGSDSIQHYPISDFSQRAESDIVYGNSGGPVGTYRVTMYVNLRGRIPQHKLNIKVTSGPTLSFSNTVFACRQRTPFGTRGCGELGAFNGSTDRTVSSSYVGSYRSSNRLTDPGTYFAYLQQRITPAGGPTLAVADLAFQDWTCPGEGGQCTGTW